MRGKPYNGDSILTNVLKPNELQSAGALAVNPLLLVFSNDNVLQSCARSEDEDSIIISTFTASACAGTTVILGPASIKSLTSSNLDRGAV